MAVPLARGNRHFHVPCGDDHKILLVATDTMGEGDYQDTRCIQNHIVNYRATKMSWGGFQVRRLF